MTGMAARKIPVGWILLILAVAGAVFWFRSAANAPLPVDQAMARGQLTTAFAATDAAHSTLTVTRMNAGGALTVVVPAGTPIYSAAAGDQRLAVARTVTIHLAKGQSQASVALETYCLDPFALQPTPTSTLSFAPPSDGTVVEETEPLRKLIACLDGSTQPHESRQFAVWMVSQNYLDLPYAQARDRIRTAYRQVLEDQAKTALNGAVRERVAAALPNLSSVDIDAAVARIGGQRLAAKLDARAERMTAADLKGFLGGGARALESCGHQTQTLEFFKDAPGGSV
jgi:hypothetical protein